MEMSTVIGSFCLMFGLISGVISVWMHKIGNNKAGQNNEAYFIGYMLIAAICFK